MAEDQPDKAPTFDPYDADDVAAFIEKHGHAAFVEERNRQTGTAITETTSPSRRARAAFDPTNQEEVAAFIEKHGHAAFVEERNRQTGFAVVDVPTRNRT